MPQVISLIRRRNRRESPGPRGRVLFFRVFLGVVCLAFLIGIGSVAVLLAQTTTDLSPVTHLDSHFGPIGREQFEAVRFYDRSGEIILFEASNPRAAAARWLYIQDDGPIDLQEHTLQAILAVADPDYFTRSSPSTIRMVRDFLGLTLQQSIPSQGNTISRSLVEAQLITLSPERLPNHIHQARVHLLSQELDRRYSRSKVLEWFINSVDFGQDAYGIDAAALVYLGKHASDLSLAESALLAPIILQPTLNPIDALEESIERQARLLDEMAELGWISSQRARSAKAEVLSIQEYGDPHRAPLHGILVRWLQQRLGQQSVNRSGLVVFTTIDDELQSQAECLLATQMERLAGGLGYEVIPAADGSACLAAGLLPPLRPRDQGLDHQVDQGAFIVLDPRTGEIIALAGAVDLEITATEVLSPFIYLAAFSQGYNPGSMVLDLPLEVDTSQADLELSSVVTAYGPVRIRTALANRLPFAVEQIQNIVGAEGVLRIARNMGIYLEELSSGDECSV